MSGDMARRVEKTAPKTAAARVIGRPFVKGADPRRPPKGGPGRPPSEIRAAMREALGRRLHILGEIADDPKVTPTERMKALDLLGKYGMGTTITETDANGQDVPRSVLVVPMTPDAGTWSAATQQQQAALEATKRTLAEQHGVG